MQHKVLRYTPISVKMIPFVYRNFSGRMMQDFDPNVDYYKQLDVSPTATE